MRMSKEGLEYHLDNWARYSRTGNNSQQARISSFYTGSHNASCEDGSEIMNESCDRDSAKVMQTLVDGLIDIQKMAIYHEWQHAVYTMRNFEQTYQDALTELSIPAGRRLVYVLKRRMA